MSLSAGERRYILESTALGCRVDGRERHAFRRAVWQLDVVPQATGSARVRLGKTDVFVGVKVELGEPADDAPDCGRIEFFVDYAPCGSQDTEEEVLETIGLELGDTLSQLWKLDPRSKTSGGLTMRDLCIVEGRTCFVIYVDATVLNVDGNVLGAVSIGTRAALHRLAIPRVEVAFQDGEEIPEIEIDEEQSVEFDTTQCPIVLSVGSVGGAFVVDMSSAEESASDFLIHVAVSPEGRVCGVASTFRRAVSLETLQTVMQISTASGVRLHEAVASLFEAAGLIGGREAL